MPDIRIDFIREPRFAIEAAKFLDSFLGDGLHSPDDFVQSATRLCDSTVVGAFEGWKMVGAASCHIATASDWKTWSHFRLPELERLLHTRTVGVLESTAVLPPYRGRGIGRQMAELRLEFLAERGCQFVAATSWDNGTGQQSKPLLTSLGFAEKGWAEGLWEGTSCPKCGDSCHCGGWLMVKSLEV